MKTNLSFFTALTPKLSRANRCIRTNYITSALVAAYFTIVSEVYTIIAASVIYNTLIIRDLKQSIKVIREIFFS